MSGLWDIDEEAYNDNISNSTLSFDSRENLSEIDYEDLSEVSPRSIQGPKYLENQLSVYNEILENPKYDPNYGKNYQYNYIDAQGAAKPEIFVIRSPNYRPPIPNSKIPKMASSADDPVVSKKEVPRKEIPGKSENCCAKCCKVFFITLGILLIIAAIITVVAFGLTKWMHTCINDFKSVNSKCWKHFTNETTSTLAEQACKNINSHLVTIKSVKDNQALENFIGSNSKTWIGLQCSTSNASQCLWSDGTHLGGYSNFAYGNPKNDFGCTYFSSTDGTWSSDYCMPTTRQYVCES